MVMFNQLMSLKNRRALITGATGGLGRVMAFTLAELGADLVLVDRPDCNFLTLITELKQWEVDVVPYECDLELEEGRRKLKSDLLNGNRDLSVLINNAAFVGTTGLSGWSVPYEQQSLDSWRRAFEVNLTSIFDLCQGLAPILKKSLGGSIINVASIYGMMGPDWGLYEGTKMSNPAAYAASKGGLIQLSRWLATTLAPHIRVNSISPGGVWRNQPQAFVERYVSRTPMGRMAKNEDFAGVVGFLASDLSAYITGQNIPVDGGWTAW